MRIIVAKVLDQTHLELSQPIAAKPGKLIQLSIPDEGEDERLWRETAKKHFLEAYDAGDDIYNELSITLPLQGVGLE
jgi:hypothetical protein